jgi:phospholipid/cholesterol/gamma-HCH transport system substrate-binding protein
MLTRFVRTQLIIFTIASIIGVAVMIFGYMQAPTLFGVGKINVKLQLPATGGLYRFSNVTYRGVQIGRVTDVSLTPDGAQATLILDTSPKIPAALKAEVRSVSAVGEQYVDLRPSTDAGPYLKDGSVIPLADTTIPQAVGPLLDSASKLVESIPKDRLNDLLGESFKAFNGAGEDLQSLLDSSTKIAGDANAVSDQTRALIDQSVPLLDSQAQTTDAIRQWSHSLAGITGTLTDRDQDFRNLLQQGPGAAQEVSRLLTDLKPTLPILLANLSTIGQILVTYNASVEQLLVLLPPYVAAQQAYGLPRNNPTGLPLGEFALETSDPPPCTAGFLPPSQWRNPADQSDIDTPDGLYCKLPQDSPVGVRGARNFPCIDHPGKRAPTVQICDSDQPFAPLAIRPHAVGAYPFDPNTISQGIPPDNRINTSSDGLYGPVDGTPMPPLAGAPAPPAAPLAPQAAQVAPAAGPAPGPTGMAELPAAAPQGTGPAPGPAEAPLPTGVAPPADAGADAAPSAYRAGKGPSVATATYDPKTGSYLTPDGQLMRQANLAGDVQTPQSWKDLMPT